VERFEATGWGVDLSAAVLRASAQFGSHRRAHFVQASVFALPFERGQFDFLYTHGVLHHTWSTAAALEHGAAIVRDGGSLYIWVYGTDDVNRSLVRRLAFAVEQCVRPVLARLPVGLATVFLLPTVPLYRAASQRGQKLGTHGVTYTNRQALHAARDRFTPLFAHRHRDADVSDWLERLGFSRIDRVSEGDVPPSWGTAMQYNVALRASAKAPLPAKREPTGAGSTSIM
jgi:SAM-dependent methyltransferase